MNALTISKQVLLLMLMVIGLSACKKDKQSNNLSKLKSLSIVSSQSAPEKIEFSYDKNGNPESSIQYLNQIPAHFFSYKYANGTLTKILDYAPDNANESNLVAEINFYYENGKLTEFFVKPLNRLSSTSTFRYKFEYGNSGIPVKYSIETGGKKLNIPLDAHWRTHIDPDDGFGDYIDRWIPAGTPRPVFDANKMLWTYSFDNHPNPLYRLPWIHPVVAIPGQGYIYTFDAQAYFYSNNKIKQEFAYNGNIWYFNSITYTYAGPDGLPDQSVFTHSARPNYRYEMKYEY